MFPAFVIQNLCVCSVASLEEKYSIGCCISICVWGYVFPTFVIQNLWVCATASLEEKYSIGCCTSCVWGYVFPAFVIQHVMCKAASLEEMYNVGSTNIRMWVCTTASLEEMYSIGCCTSVCKTCFGVCSTCAWSFDIHSTSRSDSLHMHARTKLMRCKIVKLLTA